MKVCALTMRSVHDVLAAEKILQAAGVPLRLIPVPKQVSPDCGMAVQLDCGDLARARALLAEMNERIKGAFTVAGTAFEPLEDR